MGNSGVYIVIALVIGFLVVDAVVAALGGKKKNAHKVDLPAPKESAQQRKAAHNQAIRTQRKLEQKRARQAAASASASPASSPAQRPGRMVVVPASPVVSSERPGRMVAPSPAAVPSPQPNEAFARQIAERLERAGQVVEFHSTKPAAIPAAADQPTSPRPSAPRVVPSAPAVASHQQRKPHKSSRPAKNNRDARSASAPKSAGVVPAAAMEVVRAAQKVRAKSIKKSRDLAVTPASLVLHQAVLTPKWQE